MMITSRKGVTVIEVLVVIIVITVIMVATSLSASAMKSTARVNKIIQDMYAWKQAALMWMHEHHDEIDPTQDACLKSDKGSLHYDLNSSGNEKTSGNKNNLYYKYSDGTEEPLISILAKYVDNEDPRVIDGKYENNVFKIKCMNKRWFVSYNLPADPTTIRQLITKLKSRANEVGLLKNIDNTDIKKLNPYDGNNKYFYLMIMDFNN